MSIKLSICIPTYNRAALIGKTLESIIAQATEEVEIVVSDNASTDDTAEVIEVFRARFPRLIYIREDVNRGADANYMNVVAHATGEYCWLFGSDDVMREGAIHNALEALKEAPAVLLTNRLECDLYLRPLRVRKWLTTSEKKISFEFSTDESVARYFKMVDTLGGVFSFLSSIVIKRSLWESVPMDQQFMGSAYSHVYKILTMLLRGGRLIYLNDWTVYCRLDNDTTFSKDGYLRRVMLDIDGYYALASVLLQEKPAAREALFNILQRQQNHMPAMIRLVAAASLAGNWPNIKSRILRVGLDNALINRAEKIGTSSWYTPWFICLEFLRTWKYLTKIKVAIRYLFAHKADLNA
jgi:abequosyltransferase